MSEETDNRINAVAEAILALTYGEMMSIATALAEMQSDMERDLAFSTSWAELLTSWADSQEP